MFSTVDDQGNTENPIVAEGPVERHKNHSAAFSAQQLRVYQAWCGIRHDGAITVCDSQVYVEISLPSPATEHKTKDGRVSDILN